MKIIRNKTSNNKAPNYRLRLLIGVFILILITLFLGISYIKNVGKTDKRVELIYTQSFVVNKNIRLIERNIISIELLINDLVFAKNNDEQNNAIQQINDLELLVEDQFLQLKEMFSGDREDVDLAYQSFKNWEPIRNEILAELEKNEIDQATTITRQKSADQFGRLLESTKTLLEIADQNAHESFTHSLRLTKSAKRKMLFYFVVAILLGAATIFWIVYSVNNALAKLLVRVNNLSDNDLLAQLPSKIKGKFDALNFLVNDLDERKIKMQQSLKANRSELFQAQSLYENAIEDASVGMVMISMDHKFERVNKAFTNLIGYSKEELKNLTFNDITHENDKNIGTAFIKEAKTGVKNLTTFEKRYIHKNGRIIHASITSALIKDENNNPLHFFTQIKDITQQKNDEIELKRHKEQLEEEVIARTKLIEEKTKNLEKSQLALSYLLEDVNDIREQLEISNIKLTAVNKELEAFSYSVSHDLKAPLRAVDGFSKILIEDHADSLDEEGIRVLRVIIDNSNKMRMLIDDILELSRLGRKQVLFASINLNSMVKEIIHEYQPAMANRIINWKIDELPDAKGDRVLIKQLLTNLISNAIKFTGKKETALIEIGYFKEDDKNVYFIKDNGVGFEMKYVGKVFEVFQRLHLADEFEGTGIGLAIVKRIVEKHRGKIWIESKLNIGTQIYFTF